MNLNQSKGDCISNKFSKQEFLKSIGYLTKGSSSSEENVLFKFVPQKASYLLFLQHLVYEEFVIQNGLI
jgi:hypothetical protein